MLDSNPYSGSDLGLRFFPGYKGLGAWALDSRSRAPTVSISVIVIVVDRFRVSGLGFGAKGLGFM